MNYNKKKTARKRAVQKKQHVNIIKPHKRPEKLIIFHLTERMAAAAALGAYLKQPKKCFKNT